MDRSPSGIAILVWPCLWLPARGYQVLLLSTINWCNVMLLVLTWSSVVGLVSDLASLAWPCHGFIEQLKVYACVEADVHVTLHSAPHTPIHTRTYPLTHTITHTHTYTHARTHAHTCICMHMHAYTYS